jgi:predicted AlkP superfamily phosphohydrolase/phosphomutase
MDGWQASAGRSVRYFGRGVKPVVAVLLFLLAGCGRPPSAGRGKRVIVLGVDGMDPNFVARHWDALPNLNRLREEGGLLPLATTTPPQSPVAWATFITGLDPAQHGLFDFVHRDPKTLEPISSMAQTLEPAHRLEIGPYLLPLSGARVQSFRRGRTFWEILTEHGVPVTIMRMPTNYPPQQHAGEALAGMGTPDLEGTFGTFTYYTDDPGETAREVSGGRIVPISVESGRAALPVEGPPNTLRRDRRPTRLNMVADVDPMAPVARFEAGGQQFILREGEWSPWVHVRFPLIAGVRSVHGMFRIYARELHPAIHIYRSPLNIDPEDPALPISAPAGYALDLAQHIGPFYTQGIEEDTSALRQGALNLSEYLEQSRYVSRRHRALLDECLRRFHEGLLFFYFSETDQDSHVLWGQHEDELLKTYQSVDRALGDVRNSQPGATVIVMSDHGFANFRRSVNLNAWLRSEGLLTLRNAATEDTGRPLGNVDWTRTKAYALGLNALYLNMSGREAHGIVHWGAERDALIAGIRERLAEFRDPQTGDPVILDATSPGRTNSPYAPDLIVGPAPGYRISWETALGETPPTVLEDNTDAWIGDHCIAPKAVPGVLLGTRKSMVADPSLKDLPVTILSLFGVGAPAEMTGRDIYR